MQPDLSQIHIPMGTASIFTHPSLTRLPFRGEPPEDGILSRTLFNDDRVKAVVFGFGKGEELSEHTASTAARTRVTRPC